MKEAALKIQQETRFAFKEWAAVCGALAAGTQSIILRKGGIHEGRDGFRIEHPEFWLYPTQFHQDPEQIVADARPLLDTVQNDVPPNGELRISVYAAVEEAVHITDESLLMQLAGLHILSPHVVSERFHYRTPGLFVLPVRVFRLPEPIVLPESPHFAGCRSWVDFPQSLSTDRLEPVLSDDEHREQMTRIRRALAISRVV